MLSIFPCMYAASAIAYASSKRFCARVVFLSALLCWPGLILALCLEKLFSSSLYKFVSSKGRFVGFQFLW